MGQDRAESPSPLIKRVDELHRLQAAMYAGGPVEPLAELLADDVVWHVPGSSPLAGDHRGRQAVFEYFHTRRRLVDNSMQLHPGEILADGDTVVQRVDGSARIDGEPVSWSTVGVYRFEADRVAEVWLVPTDLAKFERIWNRSGLKGR